MNIVDLKKDMKNGLTGRVYIFYGPENALIDIYIDKIKQLFGSSVIVSPDYATIKKSITNGSLLQKGRTLYVIRNDREFTSNESYWENLEQKLEKRDCVLLLKYESLDNRTKFFKRFTNNLTEFTRMQPDILCKNIMKSFEITGEQSSMICEICGCDYGRILLELNKVKNLSEALNISQRQTFQMCVEQSVFYREISGECYEFIDALLSAKDRLAYKMLQESKQRQDNMMFVMTILHNNLKTLLQIQTVPKGQDVYKTTGLTSFQKNSVSKYINIYSEQKLIKLLRLTKYCYNSIKNGNIESDMVLDYLVVNFFSL